MAAAYAGMGLEYAQSLYDALDGGTTMTVVVEEDDPDTADVDEEQSVIADPSKLFDSAVLSLGNLYVKNAAGTKLQRYLEIRSYTTYQQEVGSTWNDGVPTPIYETRYKFYDDEDPDAYASTYVAWNEGEDPPACASGTAYKGIRVAANTANLGTIWTNITEELWPAEFRNMPVAGDISGEYDLIDSAAELAAEPDAQIANWFIGYAD